jgi:hypothetical protein
LNAVQTYGTSNPLASGGDAKFTGLNLRDDVQLDPGEYTAAHNVRCRDKVPETRKGIIKPFWAHRLNSDDAALPYSQPLGAGVFRDPNGRPWIFVASGAGIYRTCPNNVPRPVALPTGVLITKECTFSQAFNNLYLFRGRDYPTLILTDTGLGFTDLLEFWLSGKDYALGDRVTWGEWKTPGAGAVTSSGSTVTVVLSAHGFVTGQDVTVRGAAQAAYNGRFNITVIDEDTFSYAFGGSGVTPATGTIKVSNMMWYWKATLDPAAGSEPGVTGDWTRIYDVLPNADNALYTNNRLLVPTAYTPGTTSYTSASSYTKKDFLIATDIQDEVQFDFADEFRINQGDSDELVDLLKFTDDVVLVFKEGTWGVLSNVAPDLANLALDMRGKEYGLASRGACIMAGTDAIFLAGRRGVVSLRQTEQGKIQGLDLPLSHDIEAWIQRINWPVARQTARLAYWDNKLYVAVPIDTAVLSKDIIGTGHNDTEETYVIPVRLGGTYRWVKGATVQHLENGDGVTYFSDTTFIATTDLILLLLTGGGGVPVTGQFIEVNVPANNTVLVYDFAQQKWAGRDTGTAQCVKEYFTFPYGGVDRLFYLDAKGYINLVEESDNGCDQVAGNGSDGFGWEPIADLWRSRWYGNELNGTRKPTDASLVLQTWNPIYSARVIFQGVNKATNAATDKTKDRTKYYRPWDAADYLTSNINDDHYAPDRQDYSVDITGGGVMINNSGIRLAEFQEAIENLKLNGRLGRRFAIEVRKSQGRLRVLGVELDSAVGRKRRGTQS